MACTKVCNYLFFDVPLHLLPTGKPSGTLCNYLFFDVPLSVV